MKTYNKVTNDIILKLKQIVCEKELIIDELNLEKYSHDELNDPIYMKTPEVVIKPHDVQQVAKIVKLANEQNIPIIPRGAGTGLTSASVPIHGGIVISFENMNKILEVDIENMFMLVEAGVKTIDIQEKAKEYGMFYAGSPCSSDISFIGGNVATNAGGNKALKYGSTRRHVYGLEIVTPTGEILTLGSKCMKDSTGYSLLNLIIGSEGTLAIITKVLLKLLPLYTKTIDLLIVFKTLKDAINTVPQIIKLGLTPLSIEFMDTDVIKVCCNFTNEKLPYMNDGCYLIVTFEANSDEELENNSIKVDELCSKNGAIATLVADSKQIWKVRNSFAEADRAISPVFSAEDLVVPISYIPQIIEYVMNLSRKYNLTIHCAGHAGDGNIHTHILKGSLSDKEWYEKLNMFQKELYKKVYEVGGKLSGEHGIGYKRVKLMEEFCNPIELKMMKEIKKALDPNLILNPGKIFSI